MPARFAAEPAAGPIRGYRWWRVTSEGLLYSAWYGDVPWTPTAFEAECLLPRRRRRGWDRRHPDGVPARDCTCGVYALHVPTFAMGGDPPPDRPWMLDPVAWSGLQAAVVFGVAEAWGRILLGTDGWRARFARPIALFVPVDSALHGDERLDLLIRNYDVAVIQRLDVLMAEWGPDHVLRTAAVDPADIQAWSWQEGTRDRPGRWLTNR